MTGGSETVRAAALINANDCINKLEKQKQQLAAKLEMSEKDADDCHKSASVWKTRFMKVKIGAEKCAACSVIVKSIMQNGE